LVNHGKWSQPGVPHRGWTCEGVEDLGEPDAICEMCERQEIRYVHTMVHPEYPDKLACGCVCAGHMERGAADDDIALLVAAAREREAPLRSLAARDARRRRALRDDQLVLTNDLLGEDEVRRLLARAQDRLSKAQADSAPTDDETHHIDTLTRLIREARIATRTKEFEKASDLYARWRGGDKEIFLGPIDRQARDFCTGGQQDDDPALAEYEALQHDVEASYSDAVAACEQARERRSWFAVHLGWRRSAKGHLYIRDDGIFVIVVKRRGGYGLGVRWDHPDAEIKWGSKTYATEHDAKLGAYDAMQHVRLQVPRPKPLAGEPEPLDFGSDEDHNDDPRPRPPPHRPG
jgi:hypothetical protein